MDDEIVKFLEGIESLPSEDQWSKVIQPCSSYGIYGEIGSGKTALAFYLVERFSRKYGLTPAIVNFPLEKRNLLPSNFILPESIEECFGLEGAILLIDEAGLQFPIESRKAHQFMINLLSLPRHRNQIIFLTYHYPRLEFGRYIPHHAGLLVKRPPYLSVEYGSKRPNDLLSQILRKANERFSEITEDHRKYTYVIAPRLRWEGMLTSPLPSFWSEELSRAWAGAKVAEPEQKQLHFDFHHYRLVATDGKTPITEEMRRRAILLEKINTPNQKMKLYIDPFTNLKWLE